MGSPLSPGGTYLFKAAISLMDGATVGCDRKISTPT
ncbi:predicted protein [Plenodomus lingam JN3]|uniref:Predicted protein n=1 Tax=Leptosphaeria maculans (strain JN3 / isolate v23.1.3 / race Av1-4-5-6-7-8) TaxID=985895 RepID=E4ZHB4_LEPMJ|nr:predicted protein [Plenodomus lingam JN3]CBX90684.1 predicted protein [Plenodomus lingam JN3]